jgi:hypothetical protein
MLTDVNVVSDTIDADLGSRTRMRLSKPYEAGLDGSHLEDLGSGAAVKTMDLL